MLGTGYVVKVFGDIEIIEGGRSSLSGLVVLFFVMVFLYKWVEK